MSISFVNPENQTLVSSTQFARLVLTAATRGALREEIAHAPSWRDWYLRLYSKVSMAEGESVATARAIADRGLEAFRAGLKTAGGHGLEDSMRQSFYSQDSDVVMVKIDGKGVKKEISIAGQTRRLTELADGWVSRNLAEPGLKRAFEFLDDNPNPPLDNFLLFAVAGMAELAPTRCWLDWGGQVAVVARASEARWRELIAYARASAGSLLVPVLRSRLKVGVEEISDAELASIAGLDILESPQQIANWLGELSRGSEKNIVLGAYAYAPAVDHIKVQGVQEVLAQLVTEMLPKEKFSFSWLATPTDSAPAPAEIGKGCIAAFSNRGALRVLRDSLLGLFQAARPARPKFWSSGNGEQMCLVDTSVAQQGPSYLLAKRTQRWRAYLAQANGNRVSYSVAPPARTESVLGHRVLRASYRGAPLFGVEPFEVEVAQSAMAAILVRDLLDPSAQPESEATHELYSRTAIHGGLWRLAYRPRSVWVAATVLGFSALLRKGY